MTTATKTFSLLLPAAILFGAACVVIPDHAFATGVPACPYNSGAKAIQTPTSWIFALLFFVAAVENFRSARKQATRINSLKIILDILACITLIALPFLHVKVLTEDLRWLPGLLLCPLAGWLAYRLMHSARFPAILSTLIATGFTAVLSWPFVFYEYDLSQRPGCANIPSMIGG